MNSTIASLSLRWASASARARIAAIASPPVPRLSASEAAVIAVTRRSRRWLSRWINRSSGTPSSPATSFCKARIRPSPLRRKSAASGSIGAPGVPSSGVGKACSGVPSASATSTGAVGCSWRNSSISRATQRLARAAGLATTTSAAERASAPRTSADRSLPAASSARSIKTRRAVAGGPSGRR